MLKVLIISNKELALLIPEINNIKSEIERLKNEEFELKNTVDTFSTKKEEIHQDIINKQEELLVLNSELENLSKTKEEELLKIKSGLENEIDLLHKRKR